MRKGMYDMAIVGGGLAGLSAAILLAREGFSVVVLEKETYPQHKVCGEYVSMESWDFLRRIGLPLDALDLPRISKLQLSAPNGKIFETSLPLGGFGMSRYALDAGLAQAARDGGVHLLEGARVDAIEEGYLLHYTQGGNQDTVQAKLCCAAWGKRSNMDLKWSRQFLNAQDRRLQNFVGVKYHLAADGPRDTIALHNFRDGYAGFSAIEEGRFCFCYMTRAGSLRGSEGLRAFESGVLQQNPHLRRLLRESEVVKGFPVTISQISFRSKPPVENGVLMLGDAAGMITPLCGNGMSIALNTGAIAARLCAAWLRQQLNKAELERQYTAAWREQFAARLGRGRLLQRFFGSPFISNTFVQAFRTFPFLARPVIRATHGKTF